MEEPALRVVRRQRVFAIGALIWAIAFAGTAWRWGRSVTHAAASPTLALDVRAQSLTFSNDRFVISQVDGWRVQVWLVDPASPARATPRVTDLAALTARARRDAQRTPKQQDRALISGVDLGPGDEGDFDNGAWHVACHLIGAGGVRRAADGRADPLASNFTAIMVCSMINFAARELLVFRAVAPVAFIVLAASSAAAATGAEPAELRAPTVQAWLAYERLVDSRLQAGPPAGVPFFALDAYGVQGWKAAAMAGRVAMRRLERPQPGGATVSVPDGKIHHWAGAIFVPGVTVEAVLQHLAKYAGRESEHYDDVVVSRLISRDGDTHKVFLKLRRTKIVTVTYNTEHTVEYRRLGTSRATARSVSARIAELSGAGTPQEREKPDGRDQGFLWRLNAYWRYEAVDGGVLIECESISLSRDVPALLKFFIGGMVEGIARESLERTLTSLKGALRKTT